VAAMAASSAVQSLTPVDMPSQGEAPSLNASQATSQELTKDEKIARIAELKVAKRTHNIDALIALYHPDVVLEQRSLGIRSHGYAELRPGLVAFAKHFPDYEREFGGFAEYGDTLIAWGETKVTLTGEFEGVKANGKRSSVMTFVMFKFQGDQIIYEGHFWDLASIARQSDVPVEAIYSYVNGGNAK